ncbi:hypothetical protein [Streptomyces sp. NPDC015130]|uniref:hypothetical protein n=1 Tax=Streptomyces sp. NPDC015130 TaxID=3364940 RepID=UPI003700BF0B
MTDPDTWPVRALASLAAVVAPAAVVAGVLLPNALALAAGLMTAALAVRLFDAARRRRGRGRPKPGRETS